MLSSCFHFVWKVIIIFYFVFVFTVTSIYYRLIGFKMQGYFYVILAIIVTGGTTCTPTHSWSNDHVRSEINPQTRHRIHKPQKDVRPNKHSKDDYHQLKHPKNKYHQQEHKAKNYHKLDHLKENYHELKNKKDNHPEVKHPKHNYQLKHAKVKSHNNRTNISWDKDDTKNINETRTEHEEPDIKFPKTYHATGLLTLPYDGIMEPFEIWYAENLNMSRIDYYHGEYNTLATDPRNVYSIAQDPKRITKKFNI